jgi:spoIIIJ-associated protein
VGVLPGEGFGTVTSSEDTVVSEGPAISADAAVSEGAAVSEDTEAPGAELASADGEFDDDDEFDDDGELDENAEVVDEDADSDEDDDEADEDEADEGSLEEEGDIAADYIEGLLDIADLDGDIDMDVEGDRAVVSVVGATLDELVGDEGEVLEALQELTRLAVHRKTGERARLMLDVGGFRARRRSELADLGRSIAEEVARTGEPKRLRAMSPFERKIVHDAVALAGLRSESEGEEPNRRVVVFPVS